MFLKLSTFSGNFYFILKISKHIQKLKDGYNDHPSPRFILLFIFATFVLSSQKNLYSQRGKVGVVCINNSNMIYAGNVLLFIFLSNPTYHFSDGLPVYRTTQII